MRRAIGIVRVSRVAGREGESFASPPEQRERIAFACERDGLKLLETIEELDVSGGTPLAERQGLKQAVEAVENGRAEVLMVGYFDRLVRSLAVQHEVVTRVEAAGGRVVAVDFGEITAGTATQWLSGTVVGAMSEYQRRVAGERSRGAQARAVARGVAPWPNIPPGYVRAESGVLEPDPETAPIVAEAFSMRASGETIKAVRTFLTANGVERSYHGVQQMLRSRVYLGELHFGKLANAEAHAAIVEAGVWQAAQRPPRGTRAKSDRLLARLGILRCGTCGSRMVVGSANHGQYPLYRCPPTGDCPRRMTISGQTAEKVVSEAAREALAEVEGRASAERSAQDAQEAADEAQAELDAAIRAFSGLEGEQAARERLTELREARDVAVAHAHELTGLHSAVVLRAGEDWDRLTLEERRALIQISVERAVVNPGRGPSRIVVHLFGQDATGSAIKDA